MSVCTSVKNIWKYKMKLSESLDVRDISWSGVDNRREHVLLQVNKWEIVAAAALPSSGRVKLCYTYKVPNPRALEGRLCWTVWKLWLYMLRFSWTISPLSTQSAYWCIKNIQRNPVRFPWINFLEYESNRLFLLLIFNMQHILFMEIKPTSHI